MSSQGNAMRDFRISFPPRLVVEEETSSASNRRITDDFLNLNNNWARSVFGSTQFVYTAHDPQELPDPTPQDLINNFNLSQADIDLKDQLEPQTIQQFLQRTMVPAEDTMDFEFEPINEIAKNIKKINHSISIPPPLDQFNNRFLEIKINSISAGENQIDISDYQGVFFLYDFQKGYFASEPLYFNHTCNRTSFTQTDQEIAYIKYRKPKETLSLVCILMHQCAALLDQFINALINTAQFPPTIVRLPIPFALSHLNLSSLPDGKFPSSWIKYSNSDCLKLIGQPNNTNTDSSLVSYIRINADISVIDRCRSELPETCLSCDSDRNIKNLPMVAEPVPQLVGDTTAAICLSNIQLLFNSTKKADSVYLKAFYCEDQTDPSKPNSVSAFISKSSNEAFANVFTSSPVPYSKKLFFSDFIKISLNSPPKPTAHIIIHVYLIQKATHVLSRVAIIPLFSENGPIQLSTLIVSTSNPTKLKATEYLQKLKTTSKTAFTVSIDVPPILFPPKNIAELSEAQVPQQVNINDLLEMNILTLESHFIPITAKLFSLMSPQTAQFFIQLYTKCTGIMIRGQLRSWIYHNLDVKAIKHNFLSAFTNSFDQLIQQSIVQQSDGLLTNITSSLDIICDIFLVSYIRKSEDYEPTSVYNFLNQISELIIYYVKLGKQTEYLATSDCFGRYLFYFRSLTTDLVERIIFKHLRALIALDAFQVDALTALFEFMLQFTVTTGLAVQSIMQLPVKPLTEVMYSPFQPLFSILFLAFYRSLSLNNKKLYEISCHFVSRLCLPLESIEDHSMIFRAGYALFPFLDIISNYYELQIPDDSKFVLLPAILFLITYSPSQLLKNYFATINSSFQNQFITFLQTAAEICTRNIGDPRCTASSDSSNTLSAFSTINTFNINANTTVVTLNNATNTNNTVSTTNDKTVNMMFKDLTQRFLQFLRYNFENLAECLPSVVSLIEMLSLSPYQTPRNFPKIFDLTRLLILRYPAQRSLIGCLVNVVTSPQHIARCFGTTLLMLFFLADFELRKSVVVSSVEFLDSFISALLHSPIEQISMYKKVIGQILGLIPFFQNETFTSKLAAKLANAANIADVIEKLRLAAHPPADRCIYVMQIADSSRNFPSMRMKWLQEIVQINAKNGWNSAAFVAQLHICALVATVVLHNDQSRSISQQKNPQIPQNQLQNQNQLQQNQQQLQQQQFEAVQFNLLVTQPFIRARRYVFSEEDFKFIPSVLVETTIDFETLSEDFKFISSDFNMDLLKSSLDRAVLLGGRAQMHYEVRCLLSIILRIAISEKDNQKMAKTMNLLKETFSQISANRSFSHDHRLQFFVKDNCVFCVDSNCREMTSNNINNANSLDNANNLDNANDIACVIDSKDNNEMGIPVNRFDSESGEMEHMHCWSIFRTVVSEEQLYQQTECDDPDAAVIRMTQYTTKNALPRYTIKSEIIDEKTVSISLIAYAKMEEEKISMMIEQTAAEFEKCFPIPGRQLNQICGNFKQSIERDLDRITSLLSFALEGKSSLFALLQRITEKGGAAAALEMAKKLREKIERLIQVYHSSIEIMQSAEHFLKYQEMISLMRTFTTSFQLPEIDTKSYEGNKNPLTDHMDYEVF